MTGTVIERPRSRRVSAGRLSRRSAMALAVGASVHLTNVIDAIVATVTHPVVQRATGFVGPVLPWLLAGGGAVFAGLLFRGERRGDSFGRRLMVALRDLYQRAVADGLDVGFIVAAFETLLEVAAAPDAEPASPAGGEE